jgi:hypothetical protein
MNIYKIIEERKREIGREIEERKRIKMGSACTTEGLKSLKSPEKVIRIINMDGITCKTSGCRERAIVPCYVCRIKKSNIPKICCETHFSEFTCSACGIPVCSEHSSEGKDLRLCEFCNNTCAHADCKLQAVIACFMCSASPVKQKRVYCYKHYPTFACTFCKLPMCFEHATGQASSFPRLITCGYCYAESKYDGSLLRTHSTEISDKSNRQN